MCIYVKFVFYLSAARMYRIYFSHIQAHTICDIQKIYNTYLRTVNSVSYTEIDCRMRNMECAATRLEILRAELDTVSEKPKGVFPFILYIFNMLNQHISTQAI